MLYWQVSILFNNNPRRRPGRLLNVLRKFNLRPMFAGMYWIGCLWYLI